MIPKQLQYTYKKQIGFTEKQHKSVTIIESYNLNINDFIRSAVPEKLKKDWPKIKADKVRFNFPF